MDKAPLVLFLSPHFDDIALSCGAIAARLSRAGARCIGLTVFAAPPPASVELSSYARELHEKWERAAGTTVQAINDVRRAEEQAAMRLLGLEPFWFDFPDAPYRRSPQGEPYYTSDEQLFGQVAPEERRDLVPLIADEIRRAVAEAGGLGRVRLYAPLGVGSHVDHQLAFRAARRLGPRYGTLLYEDYPYAGRHGALDARLRRLNLPMQPRITPVDDLIGVKIAAISRYKSQLDVLFGSADAMPTALREYSRWVAGGAPGMEYAERVWCTPPSYVLAARESGTASAPDGRRSG
jgi:LmbE family N-acetylglucosaminyl deacetylase